MKAINLPIEVAVAPTGMTAAVLDDLVQRLQQLADSGVTSVIDVASLPLTDADIEQLGKTLGRGEVEITLNTIGHSEIIETAYSGLWWVRHYTPDNILISQFIEITPIPEIVLSQSDDIALAAQQLQQHSDITGAQHE